MSENLFQILNFANQSYDAYLCSKYLIMKFVASSKLTKPSPFSSMVPNHYSKTL